MGEIRVLTEKGDEPIKWDPDDPKDVERAKGEWDRLKKEGYEFFETVESKGKKITRFKKSLGSVIAAPAPKSASDRQRGARPRGLAGGPNARRARSS